jgi:peroxiredoxin
MPFPLLADFNPKGAVADAYGVYNAERGNSRRATFVIDEQGIVRDKDESQPGEVPSVDLVCDMLAKVG